MNDLPRNWLVCRLSALGDVVLTTGVLAWLHARYGWRFTVLTREAFAPVFEGSAVVDSVVVPEAQDLVLPHAATYFRELALRCEGQGLLDLHGTARSRLLGAVWRGPVRRYPKYGLERRLFLASRGALFRRTLLATTVPQRYALALVADPPPASELVPQITLGANETAWAKSFLAKLFCDDVLKFSGGCVALHPYAAHGAKAWPEERWRALAHVLDARGIPWFVVGRGDKLFPEHAHDLTNATSIRESAALLAQASALVTGDSGPMHLACAVATPVVGLFGPTVREWGFYPSGPRDTVLESPCGCRPCSLHGKRPCPGKGECLANIEPEQVMAALAPLWAVPDGKETPRICGAT